MKQKQTQTNRNSQDTRGQTNSRAGVRVHACPETDRDTQRQTRTDKYTQMQTWTDICMHAYTGTFTDRNTDREKQQRTSADRTDKTSI